MSENKTTDKSKLPKGAVLQSDGKHFHLENEKYGGKQEGKKDVSKK